MNLHTDTSYLEKAYSESGIPESGLTVDEIEALLAGLKQREHEYSPAMLKAEAFRIITENTRISASPRDLFVSPGIWGRSPFLRIFVPDRSLKVSRDFCADIFPLLEKYEKTGQVIFSYDYAHSVPDWQTILDYGFKGLLDRAVAAEAEFRRKKGVLASAEQDFFLSIRQEYEAVLRLMERMCLWAERVSCQPETVSALRNLTRGAAGNFYEALLQIWLYYQLSEYADGIQTRSFGNLDQMLYPYFLRDLESGKFTRDEISAILRNFMYKISSMHYYWGHPFFLGGTEADGTSAVNELSFLILREYGNMGIFDPKIQVKINDNTPREFVDRILKLIRKGTSSFVFAGEPCIRKTMTAMGYSAEEARTADIKGCYEYSVRGRAVETCPAVVNLPLVMNLALQRHADAPDFETLQTRIRKDLQQLCNDIVTVSSRMEQHLEYINPAPLFSGVSASALERGMDGYARGSVYNMTNVWFSGPVTAGNSLTMIRKYVYEKQEITLPEFLNVLEADWQGYEKLQMRIFHDPDHFGNNRESDSVTVDLLETLAGMLNGRKNSRGGFFTPALHCADWFIHLGRRTGATPDGRRRGEEFSKNISPRQGTARNGVTAIVNSVLKLEPSHFMADFPLDIMFHPSAVAGEEGLNAMRSFLTSCILRGCHAVHFNVFSTEQLKDAALHPEKYQDLQIRICGWNALWNSLSSEEQLAYLKQAEANENSSCMK